MKPATHRTNKSRTERCVLDYHNVKNKNIWR